jgi:nanoRNase/pAp phosphatase (c-di-AMP/oligoRNAs hydrolase)
MAETGGTGEKPARPQGSGEGAQALKELLKSHEGERHVIVLQEYPDPDAISSALAHSLISANFKIETVIAHGGPISHQENLALVRLLDIELTRFDDAPDVSGFDGAIFVDNQGTTAWDIVEALSDAKVPTLAVVDHHELQEALKPEFADIRQIGATASIYAEYLEQGLVRLDVGIQEHVAVATALMHGIMSDTGDFIRATPGDYRAAAFLSGFRDVGILAQIMSQARSKTTMNVIRRALEDRDVVDNYSIVGVGYLREEDRDAIPQAADFLLTEENVHTSIVFGIVRDDAEQEALVGSLRTSKLTLDPDAFIKGVFGKSEDGKFFGGGKLSAGAFEIPIEFLAGERDDDYQELKWKVYETQIKTKIFEKIGVEETHTHSPDEVAKGSGA